MRGRQSLKNGEEISAIFLTEHMTEKEVKPYQKEITMHNLSRCKEKVEGKLGRWRTYHCQRCGTKFQVETLEALPVRDRVCQNCRQEER